MNFTNRIENLSVIYSNNQQTLDNAILYGTFEVTPPIAKHIVFTPLPRVAEEILVKSYKRKFPQELLALYQEMNGADLFWTTLQIPNVKVRIPLCQFSIYGIPANNDRENIEPFNISIEDLNRPSDTPDCWLKFGSYTRPKGAPARCDLFVDTDSNKTYAVEHDCKKCSILEEWDSIDDCLCSIFDRLSKTGDGLREP